MANKKITLVGTVLGIVGLLVALAVGFGMISKVLTIPWLPAVITVTGGWIVVILTIIGALMAVYSFLSK